MTFVISNLKSRNWKKSIGFARIVSLTLDEIFAPLDHRLSLKGMTTVQIDDFVRAILKANDNSTLSNFFTIMNGP